MTDVIVSDSARPLVSVIMPAYKVERYFVQCIASVVGQSLRNIEIIPIDDGSPDSCGLIMDEFAATDSRIKPIHQKNGGYGNAVNAGLDAAVGDYIAIVETDDWIEPNMLELLYQKAVDSASPVVKASFFKHEDGRQPYVCSLDHITHGPELEIFPSDCLELMLYESSIWSALYKRDFLARNGIRMPETAGAAYQDVVWKFCVYSCLDRLPLLNVPLYNYRVMSVGSSSAANGREAAMFVNYDLIRRFLEKNGTFSRFARSFYVHQLFDFVFHRRRLEGEALSQFAKRAQQVIWEADAAGVDLYRIEIHPDVRDYIVREVIPVCEQIRSGALLNAPASRIHASPASINRAGPLTRAVQSFKLSLKRILIRTLRAPFYRLLLLPLERVLVEQIGAKQQMLALQIDRNRQELMISRGEAMAVLERLRHEFSVGQGGIVGQIDRNRQELLNSQTEAVAYIKLLCDDLSDSQADIVNQVDRNRRELMIKQAEAVAHIERLCHDLSDGQAGIVSQADRNRQELMINQAAAVAHIEGLRHDLSVGQAGIVGQIDELRSELAQIDLRIAAVREDVIGSDAKMLAAATVIGDQIREAQSQIEVLSPSVRVPPSYQFEYYLRAHRDEIPEKIRLLKAGMDAASQFQVDRYFSLFSILPVNSSEEVACNLPIGMDIFSDEERFLLANRSLIMERMRLAYANLDMSDVPLSMTAMYFECGLKLVPYRLTESLKTSIALDCGASLGDTALPISRYGFIKTHCFEALPEVFSALRENITKNGLDYCIVPHCVAIDDAIGRKYITKIGERGEGSIISDQAGNEEVECTTIDEFCRGVADRVGLIKLDVEGKELAALRGAEATIRRFRPILLVAVYHTWLEPEQIFTVKAFIEQLGIGYEFQFKWLAPDQSLLYEHWLVAYCKNQFD